MAEGRRKHWGWGYEHEQPPPDEVRATAAFVASHLGFGSTEPEAPVPLSEVTLPPPQPHSGAAFFHGWGGETGALWRETRALLDVELAQPQALADACRGACATFDALSQLLEGKLHGHAGRA